MNQLKLNLILEDHTVISGVSFGFLPTDADSSYEVFGEVVFNTGMVGYEECLTDPSYAGQILILTYPLIGNYGVQGVGTGLKNKFFESDKIHLRGLIVSEYCEKYSDDHAKKSLGDWLKENKIPAMYGVDTRELTKKIRTKGVMLGKITVPEKNIRYSKKASDIFFEDPNKNNLVASVSSGEIKKYGQGVKKIIAIDCGMKNNILRCLLARGVEIKRVPWNHDFSSEENFDGLFISNGPGDPMMCQETITAIKMVMEKNIPIFGICLGSQLIALATGAKTYKLKYGHRSQNQPVIEVGSKNCFITSQNHGYAVDAKTLPDDWQVWFTNANDNTVEGIKHKTKPWLAVQFHPEACPGPKDTEWLFDEFISLCHKK
jgi:carbamoyl-phosphate synthase small subunit